MTQDKVVLTLGMKNRIGPPVRRGDFFPRIAESAELWHLTERGHVMLLAPRRVGKTSLLFHMKDAPKDEWVCVLFSVESLATEAQFVARLLREVSQAHPSGAWGTRFAAKVSHFFQSIEKFSVGAFQVTLAEALKDDWRDIGATVVEVMRSLPCNTLVLIDEFPLFVRNLLGRNRSEEGDLRAKLFLDWFREIRNAQDDSGSQVHFLLTGSLGLDAVVKAVGLTGTINDLATCRLGPLSSEQAAEFLDQLAAGEDLPLPHTVRDGILARLDWPIPYYLQLLFGELQKRVKYRGARLDEGLVELSLQSLLSAESQSHFHHWVERLDERMLPAKEGMLKKAILQTAARDRKGISRDSILQLKMKFAPQLNEAAILSSLEHDGYLTQEGDRWRFSSTLLRLWWEKWQTKTKA